MDDQRSTMGRTPTVARLTLEESFNNHKMGRVEKAAMSPSARPTSAPLVAPVGKGFLESTQTSIQINYCGCEILHQLILALSCFIPLFNIIYRVSIGINISTILLVQDFAGSTDIDRRISTTLLGEGARPRYQRYQIPILTCHIWLIYG